ncbi:MAG: hypothetical protein AAF666_19990 [Pseudomonadota bacterium]
MGEAATSAVSGALSFVFGGREDQAQQLIKKLSADIGQNWQAWSATSSHMTPQKLASVQASFNDVVPLLWLTPREIAERIENTDEIADLLLNRAAELAASFKTGLGGENDAAREFLRTIISQAYQHLCRDPGFFQLLNPWVQTLQVEHQRRQADATRQMADKQDQAADKLDQVLSLLREQHGSEVARLNDQIDQITARHAEDRDATANLLGLLLDREITPDRWVQEVERAEAEVRRLLDQQYTLPNEASEAERDLIGRARAALERFDFETAEALRREIREIGRRRRRDAQKMMAAQDAAETAEIAATVSAALDYPRAAELYREAAGTSNLSRQMIWHYLDRACTMLEKQGVEYGDNAALDRAIDWYRTQVLPIAPGLSERAISLLGLGNVLRNRGERQQYDENLLAAEKAYRDCAELYAAGDDLMAAANAMIGVGNALQTLGERETGTARLEQAVEAYTQALLERTRDRVPLQWAMTQNNLGNALRALGERETGTARLEEAIEAYTQALLEHTRDRMPLEWAAIQNNRGTALQNLGHRETGTTRLEQAVEAYTQALLGRTRDRVPLDWAATQNNLGNALRNLGERETGVERLEQAVEAFTKALLERTRDRVPLQWAATQFNIGLVEIAFFDKTGDAARLDAAERHIRAALEVFNAAGASQYIGMAESILNDIKTRRST